MNSPAMNTTALSAYRSASVVTSQRDLIVKLYVGAEGFLEQARVAMSVRPQRPAHVLRADTMCTKARDIFTALLGTLNMEEGGAIASQLRPLYAFLIVKVSEANLRKSPALIEEVLPIVRTLREGWEQIPDEFANISALPNCQNGHTFSMSS
jgi:flagellar protein FliS